MDDSELLQGSTIVWRRHRQGGKRSALVGAQRNPKGERTHREESQKEQKNIQGRNEEKVGLKETGFSGGRESQVPRIEGGGHHQTDKGGKPAIGFETDEVIGHWASNDVQQIPGSEEGTQSG